jgi:prepilin-type N-terminal cleavage/methylation domain-containing protein
MKGASSSVSSGFSLLEILVATVLMGVVLTGVYAAYLGMQGSSSSQQNIVYLQQNLRIAMATITRDLRMAGLGIPSVDGMASLPGSGVTTPVDNSSTRTSLTLNTASPNYGVASLEQEVTISTTITATDTPTFHVAVPEMVDHFHSGDSVRIVRPLDPDNPQPLDEVFTVGSSLRSGPSLTLAGFTTGHSLNYVPGDLIVRTKHYPAAIQYSLNGQNLVRTVYPGQSYSQTHIVAGNITGLKFDYVFDDGSITNSTTEASWSAVDFSKVRAVRVEVDGQVTNKGKVSKRTLVSVVKINK